MCKRLNLRCVTGILPMRGINDTDRIVCTTLQKSPQIGLGRSRFPRVAAFGLVPGAKSCLRRACICFAVGILLSICSAGDLLATAPTNDNLANAIALGPTLPITITGNNTGASLETNEWSFGSSVWYSWTAPSSGWVAIDTIAANSQPQLDTVLTVYTSTALTGTKISNLELTGYNDEGWGLSGASKMAFFAVSGTKYWISVSGFSTGTPGKGTEGDFTLHITSPTLSANVTSISFTPTSIDASVAPQSVVVTMEIVSSADPFAFASPSVTFRSSDGSSSLPPTTLLASDFISGSSTDGIYQKTISIPQGTAGNWLPTVQFNGSGETTVWSPPGNSLFQDYWIIDQNTQLLSVSSTVSSKPLLLTAFSVSPTSAALYEKVNVNLTITDAGGAGFQKADIFLSNDGPFLAEVTSANLISGNATTGNYSVSFFVSSPFAAGTYPFDVYLEDAAGSWNIYFGNSPGNILSNSTITIATDPTTVIQGWRRQFFGVSLPIGIAANLADPDKDGIVNLLEFATNHNPIAPDSQPPFSYSLAGNSLVLSYDRSYAAVAAGVQFFPEWTDNLASGNWTTTANQTFTSDSFVDHVQASVPMGTSKRKFMRLRVYLPPQ